jgi:hypothetical protein
MNYQKIYDNLIQKRKDFTLYKKNQKEIYCEEHHIIPKCMDGNDEKKNLINLFAREHFIAHELLCKIYPNDFGLIAALWRMCNGNSSEIVSNKTYENLRIKFSKKISTDCHWKNDFRTWEERYGIEKSNELKELRSIYMKEKNPSFYIDRSGINNPSFGKTKDKYEYVAEAAKKISKTRIEKGLAKGNKSNSYVHIDDNIMKIMIESYLYCKVSIRALSKKYNFSFYVIKKRFKEQNVKLRVKNSKR